MKKEKSRGDWRSYGDQRSSVHSLPLIILSVIYDPFRLNDECESIPNDHKTLNTINSIINKPTLIFVWAVTFSTAYN